VPAAGSVMIHDAKMRANRPTACDVAAHGLSDLADFDCCYVFLIFVFDLLDAVF
jgi:hypothetical protein